MDQRQSDSGTNWTNVLLASLLMVATLPGRTQGLGLISEPMMADLQLNRVRYGEIILWTSLLGAALCLPMGWLLDRCGLRWTSTALVMLLGPVVWAMGALTPIGQGSAAAFFALVLLTRSLGQSALSVASITAANRSAAANSRWAMGIYTVALSMMFIVAFAVVGPAVSAFGWRPVWQWVGLALICCVAPLVGVFFREPARKPAAGARVEEAASGYTLAAALRTAAFWIFGVSISLFGLVAAGVSIFNEDVLKERGFDRKTFEVFQAVSMGFALAGQLLCGWLGRRLTPPRMLALGMMLYAAGLAGLPMLRTQTHLWIFAGAFGIAGGVITVVFFAIWDAQFGRAQLGRIQGAAQMLTVLASAVGPVLFALSREWCGSYMPLVQVLAPVVAVLGVAAWFVRASRR